MKKIYLFLLIFVVLACSSCKRDKEATQEPEISGLHKLVEENGTDSAYVYEKILNIKGEWEIYGPGNMMIESKMKRVYFEGAVYLGDLLVGLEFKTESAAKKATELFNSASYSYYYMGKYVFPTYLGSFVLFYGVEAFQSDPVDGSQWLYDEKQDKKILALLGFDKKVENDELIIDGYDAVIQGCLLNPLIQKVKKIIIGKDVDVLYYGALIGVEFNILEFSGDIKEIHGSIINKKGASFKYTIIPDSVTYVGSHAFNNGNIYCEHKSKPFAWDSEFVTGNAKVYWADEWEYSENGTPRPKTETPTVSNNEK